MNIAVTITCYTNHSTNFSSPHQLPRLARCCYRQFSQFNLSTAVERITPDEKNTTYSVAYETCGQVRIDTQRMRRAELSARQDGGGR